MKPRKLLSILCISALILSQGAVGVVSANNSIPTDTGIQEVEKVTITANDLKKVLTVNPKTYDGTTNADGYVKINEEAWGDLLGEDAKTVSLSFDADYRYASAGNKKDLLISNVVLLCEDPEILSKYALADDTQEIITLKNCVINPCPVLYKPAVTEAVYYPSDAGNIIEAAITDETAAALMKKDNITFDPSDYPLYLYADKEQEVYRYSFAPDSLENSCRLGYDQTKEQSPKLKNYQLRLDEELLPKVYKQNQPIILDADVTMINTNISMVSQNNTLVSKGPVMITARVGVEPNGPGTPSPMISILKNAGTESEEKIDITSTDTKREDYNGNTYSVTYATFTVDLPENVSYEKLDLTCVASFEDDTDNVSTSKLNYVYNSNSPVSTLILDREAPIESTDQPLKAEWDNINKQLHITGKVSDPGAGIRSVQYKYNPDSKNYREYPLNENETHELSFSNTLSIPYKNLKTSYQNENNEYNLSFIITDHAGNELLKTITFPEGRDTKAPVIDEIQLYSEEHSAASELMNILTFGLYSNKKQTLRLKVSDQAECSAPTNIRAELLYGPKDNRQLWKGVYDQPSGSELLIDMENLIDPETNEPFDSFRYQNVTLRLTDAYQNTVEKNLREALQITGTKNNWVIDHAPPVISFDDGGREADPEDQTRYYINEDREKTLRFTVTDEQALGTVTITRNGELISTKRLTGSLQNTYTYDIPLSELETGSYHYQIDTVDAAGNEAREEISLTVDYSEPTNELVIDAASSLNDGEHWIRSDDIFKPAAAAEEETEQPPCGFIITDTIRDNHTSLEEIYFTVNGTRMPVITSADERVKTENGTTTVSVFVNTEEYKINEDTHTYQIKATATYRSKQQSTAEYTLHVDYLKPTIDRFVVADAELYQEALKLLGFGVYHNRAVELRVYPSDDDTKTDGVSEGQPVSGVGIDHVVMQYQKEDTTLTVTGINPSTDENNEVYYSFLVESSEEEIFACNLYAVAYDKLGRMSENVPTLSNTSNDASTDSNHFLMIEKHAPDLNILLPEATYSDNGKLWYHAGEYPITVNVSDTDSGLCLVDAAINQTALETDHSDPQHQLLTPSMTMEQKTESAAYTFKLDTLAAAAGREDGALTLTVTAVDNAGNDTNIRNEAAVTPRSVTVYRDTSSPSVTDYRFSKKSTNGQKKTSSATGTSDEWVNETDAIIKTAYGYFFKEDVTVKIYAADANGSNGDLSSGLKQVNLKLYHYDADENNETVQELTNWQTDKNGTYVSVDMTAGFKGMLIAQVVDNTLNRSEWRSPRAFVNDNEKPVITLSSDGEAGEELPFTELTDRGNRKLYHDNVTYTVTVSDPASGLNAVSYACRSKNGLYHADTKTISISSDAGLTPQPGVVLEDGWTVTKTDLNIITEITKTFTYGELGDDRDIRATFTAVDHSGNQASEAAESFTIDRIAPSVTKIEFISADGEIAETTDFSSTEESFIYKYYYHSSATVRATLEDTSPSSGIELVKFGFVSWTNGERQYREETVTITDQQKAENASAECTVPLGFKGLILITPVDRAENEAPVPVSAEGVVIENTRPEIAISSLSSSKTDDQGNLLFSNPPVRLNVTITDPMAGLNSFTSVIKSEKRTGDELAETAIDNVLADPDALLDNGWKIEEMDHNLVTKASRVFTFRDDDKNLQLFMSAYDRASNRLTNVESQTFTIDTTAPGLTRVSFSNASADNIKDTTGFIDELEYGFYFREKVTVTADCQDVRPSSAPEKMIFLLVPYKNGEQLETQSYEVPVKNFETHDTFISAQASLEIEQGFKGQIFITPYDRAGNAPAAVTTQAYVAENNAPEIIIDDLPATALKDDQSNKLYTGPVNVTVRIRDTESGLREISYVHASDQIQNNAQATAERKTTIVNKNADYAVGHTLANGWVITAMDQNLVTEVSQTFPFTLNDKNIRMTFGATDRSNNPSPSKTSEPFTIDTVAPTVERFNFVPETVDKISEADQEKFIQKLEYGYYFKENFNAVVTADDSIPSSGLDTIVFRLKGYENGEPVSDNSYRVEVRNKQASYLIPKGFKGQIYATAYDNAQNHSPEQTPQAFVIDETAPTITIDPLPDTSVNTDMVGNKLYNNQVSFTVTVTDTKSGLRDVRYSQTSENNTFDLITTNISNVSDYKVGSALDNGWIISKMDNNLITEVYRVFTYTDDDNAISIKVDASDRSMNRSNVKTSEPFTIDQTPSVVTFRYEDPVNLRYYKGSTTVTVTVTERNFDPALFINYTLEFGGIQIKDDYHSNQIPISFTSSDANTHTATLTFPEGDYTLRYSGRDRAGNASRVFDRNNEQTSFYKTFNVDATSPVVNVEDFSKLKDNHYFNKQYLEKNDHCVSVKVTVDDHNISAANMNLLILKKPAGSDHSDDNWSFSQRITDNWSKDKDHYERVIQLSDEYVYKITVAPVDYAENAAAESESAVFEIDTTLPELSARNETQKGSDGFVVSPFSRFYGENEENEEAPDVTFFDTNFDRIEVSTQFFRTVYNDDKDILTVEPRTIEIDIPEKIDNTITVSLKDKFTEDGVYIIKYVAYDKAGNKCDEICDTYFRMIKKDLLAYIDETDLENKTGYYSLMTPGGGTISKKASDIGDLTVCVITKKEDKDKFKVVISSSDSDPEKDKTTDETFEVNELSPMAVQSNLTLTQEFFNNSFKDDSFNDTVYLTVKYNNTNYNLAAIHIDNEQPTADLGDLSSWKNYMFTSEQTIVLTNISETLDENATKVYDCPRDGERILIHSEVDNKAHTLTFTLSEGLHHLDIVLVDMAGNEWNVDRLSYVRVGNFRLYLGIGIGVLIAALIVTIIIVRKRKAKKKANT